MIDPKIKNIQISEDIKERVRLKLLADSGLNDQKVKLNKAVKNLLIEIYRSFIIPRDFLELFDKSRRISTTTNFIDVNYKAIFGLDNNPCGNYFPNSDLSIVEELDEESTKEPIYMSGRYKLEKYVLEEALPYNYSSRNLYQFEKQAHLVSQDKLDAFKNLSLDLFKVMYKIHNFKRNLFQGIKTYNQLYNKDPELYNIAYNIYLEKKLSEKDNNDNDIPISESLKILKDILKI